MTVITLPRIPGLTWMLGEGFSVREHGEILDPDDAAEFLAELLTCASGDPEPQMQVIASLRAGRWDVQVITVPGELPCAGFECQLRELLTRTISRPVL